MTLMSFLLCVALVGLISAFAILLATKLGIIEWMQVHGDKFIAGMANCHFCLSFWVGTVFFIAVACWLDNPLYIFGGMFSAPLTRLIL